MNCQNQESDSKTMDQPCINQSLSVSYGDESAKSMQFDSLRMLCGFALMFAYSTIMLGRLNRVESRE